MWGWIHFWANNQSKHFMTTLFASLLAATLGFVEGATEFIPISSSGHLILVREVLELYSSGIVTFLQYNGLAFDAVLQLAAIVAVLIYFRADVWRLMSAALRMFVGKGGTVNVTDRIEVIAVIVGTLPGVIGGILLENVMETVLRVPVVVAISLLAGSLFMVIAEKALTRRSTMGVSGDMTIKKGFIVGLFQVFALVPGFSRSGATISGGLLLGMNREQAARFSFILSLPIIVGSGGKKMLELLQTGTANTAETLLPLLAGGLVAFITGFAAIAFLMRYLRTHSMIPFVWYRVAVALLIFTIFYL